MNKNAIEKGKPYTYFIGKDTLHISVNTNTVVNVTHYPSIVTISIHGVTKEDRQTLIKTLQEEVDA